MSWWPPDLGSKSRERLWSLCGGGACGSFPPVAVLVIALLLLVAGCGGSSDKTYKDPIYHFTMALPLGWSAPAKGSVGPTPDGVVGRHRGSFLSSWVPCFVVRGAGLHHIRDGLVIQHTAQCPDVCVFHQTKISGRPRLVYAIFDATGHLTQEDISVNSRYGYEIALLGAPQISKGLDRQYRHVAASFRIAPKH